MTAPVAARAKNWRRLAVIAGAGPLPVRLADAAAERPGGVFVIRLEGLADAALGGHPGADCGLAEAGKLIRLLKDNECDAVTLAGLVRRPDFSRLKTDWRGAALLPRVIAAAARGDGALLGVLVSVLEEEGFAVVGAETVLETLTAPRGAFGVHAPGADELADIRKAAALIAALGPFDVGQGAVVSGGLVLAVEAAEGTDAMLARCADLSADFRGGAAARGVLVKRPKPQQELRVDLPTIGVETIRRAAAAGLKGVGVEAGRALVLDHEGVVREADAAGLFVYGFTADEVLVRAGDVDDPGRNACADRS